MLRKFSFLLFSVLFYTSCNDYDGSGCEKGYIKQYGPNNTSFCVESYIQDNSKEYKAGESYYHNVYGLITFANDVWTNQHNQVIKP